MHSVWLWMKMYNTFSWHCTGFCRDLSRVSDFAFFTCIPAFLGDRRDKEEERRRTCWHVNQLVLVTLIPFATFSTFHALGYIRTNIIPTVFPAPSNGGTWQGRVQQQIKAWTDKNYDAAMRFVAQIEVVVIMGRLLLGIFRWVILVVIRSLYQCTKPRIPFLVFKFGPSFCMLNSCDSVSIFRPTPAEHLDSSVPPLIDIFCPQLQTQAFHLQFLKHTRPSRLWLFDMAKLSSNRDRRKDNRQHDAFRFLFSFLNFVWYIY